ncbi:14537_t:CDS:1, partial [Gigaspora margarita]
DQNIQHMPRVKQKFIVGYEVPSIKMPAIMYGEPDISGEHKPQLWYCCKYAHKDASIPFR